MFIVWIFLANFAVEDHIQKKALPGIPTHNMVFHTLIYKADMSDGSGFPISRDLQTFRKPYKSREK